MVEHNDSSPSGSPMAQNSSSSNNVLDNLNNVLDTSNNVLDNSMNPITIEPGLEIRNTILLNDPNNFINTTFTSTEPDKYDPNIKENLLLEIITIDDENENKLLLNQIKDYARNIRQRVFYALNYCFLSLNLPYVFL